MNEAAPDLASRLDALVPLLRDGRATHVEWRDWLRLNPANEMVNPHCGNAEFHEGMVREYDERIAVVTEAAAYIREEGQRGDE